jgi:peptidoglycan/LPS O-acetylase OafA/YrhL
MMAVENRLSGAFSSYLDFVRLSSALAVVVFHCGSDLSLTGPNGWSVGQMGIDAVAVFFVLSGLVISTVTKRREAAPAEYASARLARLYSVLVPALALTLILDRIGQTMNAVPYVGQADSGFCEYLVSLFFGNEIWWLDIIPGSDRPIWSLALEAWYYLIFGVLFFCRRVTGAIVAAGLFLIAGPKLIVLAPCWFFGVLVAKAIYRDIPRWLAWAAAILPVAIFIVFLVFDFPVGRTLAAKLIGSDAMGSLHNAAYFPRFWFVSVLVSVHFVGMSNLLYGIEKGSLGDYISKAAQFTYSIYLFHFPIKTFLVAIPGLEQYSLRPCVVLALSIALPICLGMIFEPTRFVLRRYLSAALRRINFGSPARVRIYGGS